MTLTEAWRPWTSTQTLLGREAEVAILSQLVHRTGVHGGALAIDGEAGMGKLALLESAAQYAADHGVRLLRASGVRAEQEVTYSGLGQLLLPTMSATHALPHRSREALRTAFGHAVAARPPQRLLVAVAELFAAPRRRRAPAPGCRRLPLAGPGQRRSAHLMAHRVLTTRGRPPGRTATPRVVA